MFKTAGRTDWKQEKVITTRNREELMLVYTSKKCISALIDTHKP